MVAPINLFLLRHGEVEAPYRNVFGGRIDMGLSPRGQEQAALLAKYLRARTIHAFYASPMKRAQQTLAQFAAQCTAPPIVLEGLQEVDFGAWTGLDGIQVRERFHASASEWTEKLEAAAIPNAESVAGFRARVESCLRQMTQSHPGQNIAVVCHGGVIRMMLAILFALPFAKMGFVGMEYASLTHVELLPHRIKLQLLNFTPWRDLA